MTIRKIWLFELLAAGILFLAILYIDFQIYRNITVEKQGVAVEAAGSGLYLRKSDLVEAVKKLKEHQDFVENPIYPLIKNPF